MKKVLRQHINRKPLLALAIILFGVAIAIYTNASASAVVIREGFTEDDSKHFPIMKRIYSALIDMRINFGNTVIMTNNITVIKNAYNKLNSLANPPASATSTRLYHNFKRTYLFLTGDANFMQIYNSTPAQLSTLSLTTINSVIQNIEINFPARESVESATTNISNILDQSFNTMDESFNFVF